MPTYEYVCESCEHGFETFQSITARSLKKCPECGKNKLKRLIGTGAGIIFKGSGFYETDYRSDSYKAGEKQAKETTTTKSEDSGKKDAKDSKAKAESKPKSESTGKAESKGGKKS